MAKILYWNIQDFGSIKIDDQRVSNEPGTSIPKSQASADRSRFIINTMLENDPDIIVVVETITTFGTPGALIKGKGAAAALLLLKRIRDASASNWGLVPPIRLGVNDLQEGISVYYNTGTIAFTGPWMNKGGDLPSGSAAPGITYAAPWADCLPGVPVPTAPAGILNRGVQTRQLAGQWAYTVTTEAGAIVPLAFPGANNRTPYLTTFWDLIDNRAIKLLSFHAAPNENDAITGTNQISRITEMNTALVGQEAQVILGDFNVNLFNKESREAAYDNIIANGYARQINPTQNKWPDKGYVATKMISKTSATPWETCGYPGYGYAGGNTELSVAAVSIDNILTKGGAANNITIVNKVTGSPYDKVVPAPNAAPTGHYPYTTGMSPIVDGELAGQPAALPLPPNGPNGNGGTLTTDNNAVTAFRLWENYGHIRSTSDHIALIIDI